MPVQPMSTALRASAALITPLRQNWPSQQPHHLFDIGPVERRIEQFGEIASDRQRAAAEGDVRVELRQAELFVGEVVDRPAGLQRKLRHAGKRQAERNREAGAQVALAVAAGDAVDGQHHDLHAGRLGPLQHRPVEPAVLVEIELIDLRRAVLAQFLERHGAEGGHSEHGAVARRGGCHGALAVIVKQPLQRRRRAIDRHCQCLAHDRDREVDLADPGQHARHEVAIVEGGPVAAQGDLVVGAPVDIVEDRPRQPLLGQSGGSRRSCGSG